MNFRTLCVTVLILIIYSLPLAAESVYLNDGTIIECKIIEHRDKEIIIKDNNNKIRKISNNDISMILKSRKPHHGRKEKQSERTEKENKALLNESSVEIAPGVLLPLGKLGEMSGTGYGLSISFIRNIIISDSMNAGITAGFYNSEGKDLTDSNSRHYKEFNYIPFYFSANYVLNMNHYFSIEPELSAGGIYFRAEYTDHSTGPLSDSDKSIKKIEPSFKAGLSLRYRFKKSFSASISSDYGIITESSGLISFLLINAGVSYHF